MNKTLSLIFISNLPTVIAICGAIYLAAQGKDGWGWFIFLALLLSTTVNTKISG